MRKCSPTNWAFTVYTVRCALGCTRPNGPGTLSGRKPQKDGAGVVGNDPCAVQLASLQQPLGCRYQVGDSTSPAIDMRKSALCMFDFWTSDRSDCGAGFRLHGLRELKIVVVGRLLDFDVCWNQLFYNGPKPALPGSSASSSGCFSVSISSCCCCCGRA